MESEKFIKNIVYNINNVIIGKEYEIFNILKGIIAGGHILIEDVPGVGKTTLVKALAKSLNLNYNRIQFTPDLLPSDILGVSIYNQKAQEFQFIEGPIFTNILLADEINRTSPKTQSALLEVMEEKQVSEGRETYKLSEPFIVLATQNPIEYEGTFIMPEAQLDRFMIKVNIGYPEKSYEEKMLKVYRNENPIEKVNIIGSREGLLELQEICRGVHVSDDINTYIVNLSEATRNNKCLSLGVSPRASLALLKIAQASALINSRTYVIPEDVKENVVQVYAHRIILSPFGRANNYTQEQVIKDIIKTIPVPRIKRDIK